MDPRPTTDVSDAYPDALIPEPLFTSFGGVETFAGIAATVQCFEDNTRVRAKLNEAGAGRVLVVDGGGSLRCALLGDNVAQLGASNDWAGIIVFGCVRDSAELAGIAIGVQALATHPRRSEKRDEGRVDVPVSIAGARVAPGDSIYADIDGIVIVPAGAA